jgi:hypothetical protein
MDNRHKHVRVYVCMYVCMYLCMYVCMYVYMYVYVYVYVYVCMYACMYLCLDLGQQDIECPLDRRRKITHARMEGRHLQTPTLHQRNKTRFCSCSRRGSFVLYIIYRYVCVYEWVGG